LGKVAVKKCAGERGRKRGSDEISEVLYFIYHRADRDIFLRKKIHLEKASSRIKLLLLVACKKVQGKKCCTRGDGKSQLFQDDAAAFAARTFCIRGGGGAEKIYTLLLKYTGAGAHRGLRKQRRIHVHCPDENENMAASGNFASTFTTSAKCNKATDAEEETAQP